MRLVPVKSEAQQVVLALHRLRAQLMKMRIMQANELRGLLYGARQSSWPACCLTKKCYPTDGCRSCWFPRRAEETASGFAALGRGGWGLPQ